MGVRVWFRDERSGATVGPLTEGEIEAIYPIDGPWQTAEEVQEQMRSL